MTTGRINQVTTFQSAFAAIIYSRVTNTRFRDVEFIFHPLWLKIHRSSMDRGQEYYYVTSSNIEPANDITSFPILARPKWDLLFPVTENKGHPPTMRTTDVRRHLKGACVDVADPRVASCIRFDHRQAIHLLQHRSSLSQKDSSRLQQRQKRTLGQSPSSRLPTWQDSSTRHKTTQSSIKEAYLRGEQTESAQSPLSTSDTKPTDPTKASDNVSLGWTPFRDVGHVKETSICFKPIRATLMEQGKNNKASTEKRNYTSRRAQTRAPLSSSFSLSSEWTSSPSGSKPLTWKGRKVSRPPPFDAAPPYTTLLSFQSPSEFKRGEPTGTPYQDNAFERAVVRQVPFNPLSIQ